MRRIAAVVLALLLAACGSDSGRETGTRLPLRVSTDDGTATLHVEIADAPDERSEGLSNRASLPEDAGMAFLWDEPVRARFWMKDTLIPLQIAFWDADGAIFAILDMEPCAADPCPTYGPEEPFAGAAEANADWFTSQGVDVGDTVDLDAGDA